MSDPALVTAFVPASERKAVDRVLGEIQIPRRRINRAMGGLAGAERRADLHRQIPRDIQLEQVSAHEISIAVGGIYDRGIHALVVGVGSGAA